MVINNSPRGNRRQAQRDARRQRQQRARSLVNQGNTGSTINTVAQTGGRAENRNPRSELADGTRESLSSTFRAGNLTGSPMMRSNAAAASQGAPRSSTSQTDTGQGQTGSQGLQVDFSGYSSDASRRMREFTERRRKERLARVDPTNRREVSIIGEQIDRFNNEWQQEAQTDTYKQRAFEAEGFRNDGTDEFNDSIKSAFDIGGRAAAMRVVSRIADSAGENVQAQQQARERALEELRRIEAFKAINEGTYQFEEDKQALSELESEFTDEQSIFEQQQQKEQEDLKFQRQQDSSQFESIVNETGTYIDELELSAKENPEIAGIYNPIINNLKAQQISLLQERFELDRSAHDSSDFVESLENQQDQLLVDKVKSKELIQRSSDLKIQAAKEAKAAMEAQLEIKKIADSEAQIRKSQENVKQEVANRRLANRFGIEADTNGLRWMQEETEEGARELENMKKIATIENASIVSKITGDYYQRVEAALIEHDAKSLEIDSTYRAEALNISNIINQTEKEEAAAAQERIAAYWEKKNKLDSDTAATLSSERQAMFNERLRIQGRTDQQIQQNFARLMQFSATYGSTNPGAMQDVVDELTRLGVDMSGFDVNAQTQSELGRIAATVEKVRSTEKERTAQKQQAVIASVSQKEAIAYNLLFANAEWGGAQRLDQVNAIASVAPLKNDNVYKQQIITNAAITSLEKTDQKEYQRVANIDLDISEATRLLGLLKDTGIITAKKNELKKYAGTPMEANYNRLREVVGRLSSAEANKIFGANFTESEQLRAQAFLPDGRLFDEPENIQGLLDGMQARITRETNDRVKRRIGGDFYGDLIGDQRVLDIQRGGGDVNTGFDRGMATGQTTIDGLNYPTFDGYSESSAASNIEKLNKGAFPLPKEQDRARTQFIMDDVIITGYGSPYAPNGLDLYPVSGKGASIVSPFSGTVTEAISSYNNSTNKPDPTMYAKPTYGNRLTMKLNNGYSIAFAHLDSLNLKKGDKITPGMALGYIGNTGTTMGPTGVHADIAVYDKDGNTLTAREVAAFLQLTKIS